MLIATHFTKKITAPLARLCDPFLALQKQKKKTLFAVRNNREPLAKRENVAALEFQLPPSDFLEILLFLLNQMQFQISN
jgi:hypothetical protein